MAAAGACFAAGAHLHDIRAGLRTFSTSYHLAPGRLNQIDVNGVTVFVDYAHNPAGLAALGDFVAAYTDGLDSVHAELHKRRRIGVVGTAGDRRDEDIIELGRTAALHFDVCVVKEDANPRGRQHGEVAALVEQGALQAIAEGARAKEVRTIPDEIEAVRWALGHATGGDVVAICADSTDAVYSELESLGHEAVHE
jgi:cyanophycin synthetase